MMIGLNLLRNRGWTADRSEFFRRVIDDLVSLSFWDLPDDYPVEAGVGNPQPRDILLRNVPYRKESLPR